MTRITDSKADRLRFSTAMMRLYKAHGLQVDNEHIGVYLEALKSQLHFESFEYAVQQSLIKDERFPKIPRLIALALAYRAPVVADLSRPAIADANFLSKEKLTEIFETLDAKYGTSFVSGRFEESEARQGLRVARG